MRVRALLLALFLLVGTGFGLAVPEVHAQDDVRALVERMTLEEKVGQMTQLTIQAVSSVRGVPGTSQVVSDSLLRKALVERHVGSLLNVYDKALTRDEWVDLTDRVQSIARNETRLGIPVLYGIDAVHGNNYMYGATIFPQNIGIAATWNLDLVREASRITAQETRDAGMNWNFAPVLDVARTPLWSRFFETFGEDVFAVGAYGRASIEAMQQPGPDGYPLLAATGKHFLGYSAPISGKDRTPAWIPERQLRELFLPPFHEAMDGGLLTVMVNSSEINGIPVHSDPEMLTDLLRTELGFEGLAVTDWEDIGKLVSLHSVAATYKEAVYMSVLAGIDMAMVPYDYTFTDALIELVREGRISEARIDESVYRILSVKQRLGLMANPQSEPTMAGDPETRAASQAASLDAARQSMTLLKNNGVLPAPLTGNILLAGPAAEYIPMMYGSWTYTWQGNDVAAYPDDIPTLHDVLAARDSATVTLAPWGASHEADRLRAWAYGSDVAVLALGEVPSVEKPGDIEDLELPADQIDLVRTVAETGVPVVVVLFQNRPRIIRQIEPMVDAIVLAYLPGPFGAQAVVETLDGTWNPGGHLPFTYPRFSGSLVPYDHKNSDRNDVFNAWNAFQPQYPFGHGLSYTTFDYTDLEVDAQAYNRTGTIKVGVTITNTGTRAGRDAALLFVRDHVASVTPAVRRLKAFESVHLEPGERRRLNWTLDPSALSFIGRDLTPVVEPGVFSIHVEDLEVQFELE
ncbi:MAG: glycoside hydrolase family 3 N-terminal domain-containing protein [Rhodothermales bacterium]